MNFSFGYIRENKYVQPAVRKNKSLTLRFQFDLYEDGHRLIHAVLKFPGQTTLMCSNEATKKVLEDKNSCGLFSCYDCHTL